MNSLAISHKLLEQILLFINISPIANNVKQLKKEIQPKDVAQIASKDSTLMIATALVALIPIVWNVQMDNANNANYTMDSILIITVRNAPITANIAMVIHQFAKNVMKDTTISMDSVMNAQKIAKSAHKILAKNAKNWAGIQLEINATHAPLIIAQFARMTYVKHVLMDSSLNTIKITGLKPSENAIHAKFLTASLVAKGLIPAHNVKMVGNFLVKEKMTNVFRVI